MTAPSGGRPAAADPTAPGGGAAPRPAGGAVVGEAVAGVGTFWTRVAGTFGTRAGMLLLGVGTSILTARLLGPAGRGSWAVMMTLGALGVQFGNAGIPSAVTHHVGADRRRLPALSGLVLGVALIGGGIVAGVGLGVLAVVPALRPLEEMHLLLLAAAWIPLGLLLTMGRSLLLGIQRIRAYNGADLAQAGLALAAMGVLALVGLTTVEGFYLAALGGAGIAGAGAFVVLRRASGGRVEAPGRKLVREVVGYGFRAYLATLFSFVVLSFDLFMVSGMLGEADAGQYSISARMAEWLYQLPAAVGAILFSTVSGMSTGRWRFTRRIAATVAVGLVPVLAVAGLVASPLVGLLYGEMYAPAVPAFLWLLPGIYFVGVNTVFMNHFAGIGMPWVAVAGPAAAAVANIGLNLLLLPGYGIVGAALASTAAYALMLLISLGYVTLGGGDR